MISHCRRFAYLGGMTYLHIALTLAATLSAALPAQATTQDEILDAALLPGWQMENGHHMSGLALTLAGNAVMFLPQRQTGRPIGAAPARRAFRRCSIGQGLRT